jgi:RNA methyltransferase, TrmH family
VSGKRIESRANPALKSLLALTRSVREQRRAGVALLDGPHLVEALGTAGLAARLLIASDSGLLNAEVAALFSEVAAAERWVLTDRLFAELSPVATPVGILAVVAVPAGQELPADLEDAVVLDRLQEPGNVGSILRSAAAAGVRRIIATPGTTYLWSAKVLRAGQGAHFQLAIHEGVPLQEIASRAVSGAILATRLDDAVDLYAIDLRGPCVWLFGNEGAGLDGTAAHIASRGVRIPMRATSESLNVAAAAAVCLFEQRRQRGAGAA